GPVEQAGPLFVSRQAVFLEVKVKSIVSVSIAAFALICSGTAQAADLPVAPAYKSPAVAAVYNWSGLYVGVNGGYGWGNQDPLVLFGNRFDRSSMSMSGGMIGGTIGAQIQQGYVVLGVEGDLDWANIKGRYVTI